MESDRPIVRLSRRHALVAALGGLVIACTPSSSPSPAAPTQPAAPATPAPPTAPAPTAPASAAAPNAAPTKPSFSRATVRFATITAILDNAIWMVGREKGFFDELGIDLNVEMLRDDSVVIQSILAGESDFADGGAGAPLGARVTGAPVKIIGSSRPRVPFLFFGQPEIEGIDDLRGRTIGVPSPGTLPYLMVLALLDKRGISENDVTLANIGATPLIYQAVVAKKVDAGPAPVNFLPRAEADGVKSLGEMWKDLPDYMANAFYAHERAIAERGDAIARAMAGLARSYRYTFDPASREAFVRMAVEELENDQVQAEFYWDFLQTNREILAQNLEVTERELQFSQDINVRFGNQTRVLPFAEVTDLSLQRMALDLVGRV